MRYRLTDIFTLIIDINVEGENGTTKIIRFPTYTIKYMYITHFRHFDRVFVCTFSVESYENNNTNDVAKLPAAVFATIWYPTSWPNTNKDDEIYKAYIDSALLISRLYTTALGGDSRDITEYGNKEYLFTYLNFLCNVMVDQSRNFISSSFNYFRNSILSDRKFVEQYLSTIVTFFPWISFHVLSHDGGKTKIYDYDAAMRRLDIPFNVRFISVFTIMLVEENFPHLLKTPVKYMLYNFKGSAGIGSYSPILGFESFYITK